MPFSKDTRAFPQIHKARCGAAAIAEDGIEWGCRYRCGHRGPHSYKVRHDRVWRKVSELQTHGEVLAEEIADPEFSAEWERLKSEADRG